MSRSARLLASASETRSWVCKSKAVARRSQAAEGSWGYARSPVVRPVQLGKVLVPKQLAPLTGQKTMEGISSNVVEVVDMPEALEMVRLKQAALCRSLAKHDRPPLNISEGLYSLSSLRATFRPRF